MRRIQQIGLVAAIIAALVCCGCQQMTKAPSNEREEQRAPVAPAASEKSAAFGNTIDQRTAIYYLPGGVVVLDGKGLPVGSLEALRGPSASQTASHVTTTRPAGESSEANTDAGFAMQGIYITNTSSPGGTIPTQGMTQTSTASASQNQAQNPAVSPQFRASPVFQTQLPVQVSMPGSAPSQQPSFAGQAPTGESASTSGPQSQTPNQAPVNDIRWASVMQKLGQCGADAQNQALSWLESFLNGGKTATTQTPAKGELTTTEPAD